MHSLLLLVWWVKMSLRLGGYKHEDIVYGPRNGDVS